MWHFDVGNPSECVRTDFVQVDLEALNVDGHLDEHDLVLYRSPDGKPTGAPIPFQIDHILGRTGHRLRVLSFVATDVPCRPPGDLTDNYASPRAKTRYELRQKDHPARQSDHPTWPWIGYYYATPMAGEPPDGFNRAYFKDRPLRGFKIANSALEAYVNLRCGKASTPGAVTSAVRTDANEQLGFGEMLASSLEPWSCEPRDWPDRCWGHLSSVSISLGRTANGRDHSLCCQLEDCQHHLVWNREGPVRAVAVIRVDLPAATIGAAGSKNFRQLSEPSLFRVLSVYSGEGRPYYNEETIVTDESGGKTWALEHSPSYRAMLPPASPEIRCHRLPDVPDYFALWRHFGPMNYRGYGYACNAHVKDLTICGGQVSWRLGMNTYCVSSNDFYFHRWYPAGFDPLNDIGVAWYARILKPLRALKPSDQGPVAFLCPASSLPRATL